MVHQYFDPANSETFNALATKTDNKYDLYYFGLFGISGTVRTILAVSDANFTSNNPPGDTWKTQYKPRTPFGVMPVLRETFADGSLTFLISETDAIERYLSRKFGYFGKTALEDVIISQFQSSTNSLIQKLVYRYLILDKDPELRAANKEKLLGGPIIDWICIHEKHLSENPVAVAAKEEHGNGHYVGDSISLADLKTVQLIDMIRALSDKLISKDKTPALWKVKENIETTPSVLEWKATEDYQKLAETNLSLLGY